MITKLTDSIIEKSDFVDHKNKNGQTINQLMKMDKNYCKLFLGGVSDSLSNFEVIEILKKICDVITYESEIYENKKRRGYGYAIVKNMSEAKKLLSHKDFIINGRRIDVKIAETKEESMAKMAEITKRKLHISKLTKKTDEDMQKTYFSTFGEIEYAYVVYNLKNKKTRNFGFVLYKFEDSIKKINEIIDHFIDNKKIIVEKCVMKNEIKVKC